MTLQETCALRGKYSHSRNSLQGQGHLVYGGSSDSLHPKVDPVASWSIPHPTKSKGVHEATHQKDIIVPVTMNNWYSPVHRISLSFFSFSPCKAFSYLPTSKTTAYGPRRTLRDIQRREHRSRTYAKPSDQPTHIHEGQGAPRAGLEGHTEAGHDACTN